MLGVPILKKKWINYIPTKVIVIRFFKNWGKKELICAWKPIHDETTPHGNEYLYIYRDFHTMLHTHSCWKNNGLSF